MTNYMSKAVYSRRMWRTVSYVLFATGAYIGIYAPSKVITEVASHNLATAWSIIFAFSVSFAIIGNVRKNLFIEYVAMPAMGAAFAVYAMCLFWSAGDGHLNRVPIGFFILGITAFTAARYSELDGQIRGQRDDRAEWPPHS